MEINDKVQILASKKYNNQFEGMYGYVERAGENNCGIRIDNKINKSSGYGLFWFNQANIILVSKIKNKENEIMLENCKTAIVKFLDGTNQNCIYHYALFDDDVVENDFVVVNTGHHGYSVAQIVKVLDEKSKQIDCGREVIGKIDFSTYEDRKNKRIQMAQIKKEMDKRIEELKVESIYEMFAEKDPTLRTLLTNYNTLKN